MQKVSALVLVIFLTGKLPAQVLLPTTIKSPAGNRVQPALKGTWKSVGGGYLLDINDSIIILYSYTGKHCYKEKNDYLGSLLNNSSKFTLNSTKDSLLLYLQDFGNKTKYLQAEHTYYKLNSLPDNCGPLTTQQQQDPEFLFELFWHTLKGNYAFAKERNMDWEEIYNKYRPTITPQTTQEELFNKMGEIVSSTKDQHTKIIAKDGRTKQYSGVPSAILLREVFNEQDSIKDFGRFASMYFNSSYSNISQDLLHGKGKKVARGTIEWGDITPSIGYINIHALSGFADSKLPRRQHIDTLNYFMTQIMRAFHNKKAIIVDVSLNFGGYDAAGLTIAGYFTGKPHKAYTRYTFQNGSFHKGTEFTVHPSGRYEFNKPVYVVTSDISRSAAESFVMQMKALPNVTVVGTNTLGILSDMLGKTIGDYYLTISNEKYISPKGKFYEVTGVDVDEPIEIFPKSNMFNGHRDAVLKVVDLINNKQHLFNR